MKTHVIKITVICEICKQPFVTISRRVVKVCNKPECKQAQQRQYHRNYYHDNERAREEVIVNEHRAAIKEQEVQRLVDLYEQRHDRLIAAGLNPGSCQAGIALKVLGES